MQSFILLLAHLIILLPAMTPFMEGKGNSSWTSTEVSVGWKKRKDRMKRKKLFFSFSAWFSDANMFFIQVGAGWERAWMNGLPAGWENSLYGISLWMFCLRGWRLEKETFLLRLLLSIFRCMTQQNIHVVCLPECDEAGWWWGDWRRLGKEITGMKQVNEEARTFQLTLDHLF